MSDLEDGDDESNKETPQEAENDFIDAGFDFNVSHDDDIQQIINHRESSNKDGEPTVAKTSDSEPKANQTTCNGNKAAKVVKPSDKESKRRTKHNADRSIPNENKESNSTKPSELKRCCKQRAVQPMDNDDQEMHALPSEIDSTLRQQQHLKLSAVNLIHGVGGQKNHPEGIQYSKVIKLANPQKTLIAYALLTISKCFGLIILQNC